MCDLPGKELIYVETSAETTYTMSPQDLTLLLMMLWGHLTVENLDLDGIEFVDPKDMGCSSEYWGKAARKSMNRQVAEYVAKKEEKPGLYAGFKDRILGIFSGIGNDAKD